MEQFLPVYQGDQVTCELLRPLASEKRLECMVSTGLCQTLMVNEFALDRWTDSESFPYIIPQNGRKPAYYHEVLAIKDQFVDALFMCKTMGIISPAKYEDYISRRGYSTTTN